MRYIYQIYMRFHISYISMHGEVNLRFEKCFEQTDLAQINIRLFLVVRTAAFHLCPLVYKIERRLILQ